MNPYQQQPYGPPGYGTPPTSNYNYYGPGYQGYGNMPPVAPPGPPYTMQSSTGYPAPPVTQDASYGGYPSGGYYSQPLPYGTAPPPYGAFPQGVYSGPPYNPYGQTGAYSPYPGQYDQSGQPTTSVGDNGSYPASTVSYGFPSGQPYPACTTCPAPDSTSGYPRPSTSYNSYPSTSTSYCNNQFSTTVTDSIATSKPDNPLPPTLPYGESSSDEKSGWRDDGLADSRPHCGSPSNWRTSSPSALPTPRPRARAATPTGEMGDKASGKERRGDYEADKRGVLERQTTAEEWSEIADIIKEEKVKGKDDDHHMDPKQLSGISSDDPAARADYKRKLNALANLMTDVSLDKK